MRVVYVVAAALINEAGHILLAQRPEGKSMAGLWEFPGGKIETGETPEQALARELNEELGLHVKQTQMRPATFVSHAYQTFNLFMPLYIIKEWRGMVTSNEGQSLVWVPVEELRTYPAPEADLPLFEFLEHHLRDFK